MLLLADVYNENIGNGDPSSAFKSYLKKIRRNADTAPMLKEITIIVEEVRVRGMQKINPLKLLQIPGKNEKLTKSFSFFVINYI